MKRNKKAPELTEDIEVVGPGQILAEAREKIGLSQQEVADKLNFRLTLVKDIEADIFDKSLPATYNRGYLRNYAKLVDIAVEDVLASYEMLGVAEAQGAEMQSFSKITEKQAQNNRLMWVTYLILAVLIGSTLLWWIQGMDIGQQVSPISNNATNEVISQESEAASAELIKDLDTEPQSKTVSLDEEQQVIEQPDVGEQVNIAEAVESAVLQTTGELPVELAQAQSQPSAAEVEVQPEPVQNSVTTEDAAKQVIFNFAGDCWVNIYDATGERIAWGVKKAGYEMTISGIAPFKVTLGKPELVQINYDGQDVDMSQFNVGNIAKFNLPLES